MDFSFLQVTGIDVTAVRSCFLILRHLLAPYQIVLLLAALKPSAARLFVANGVLDADVVQGQAGPQESPKASSAAPTASSRTQGDDSKGCRVLLFENRSAAMEYAENQLLKELRLSKSSSSLSLADQMTTSGIAPKPLEDILRTYFRKSSLDFLPGQASPPPNFGKLKDFFQLEKYQFGDDIFAKGDLAQGVLFSLSLSLSLSLFLSVCVCVCVCVYLYACKG